MGTTVGNNGHLFDDTTGEWVGALDNLGREQLVLGRAQGTAVRTMLAQQIDTLPSQVKAVSATGQVCAGPCKLVSIRCLTAGTVTLRDSVTQTAAGTDTTSPTLYTAALAAGDVVRVPVEAFFGLHATVASGTYELEF